MARKHAGNVHIAPPPYPAFLTPVASMERDPCPLQSISTRHLLHLPEFTPTRLGMTIGGEKKTTRVSGVGGRVFHRALCAKARSSMPTSQGSVVTILPEDLVDRGFLKMASEAAGRNACSSHAAEMKKCRWRGVSELAHENHTRIFRGLGSRSDPRKASPAEVRGFG